MPLPIQSRGTASDRAGGNQRNIMTKIEEKDFIEVNSSRESGLSPEYDRPDRRVCRQLSQVCAEPEPTTHHHRHVKTGNAVGLDQGQDSWVTPAARARQR
jgi:hypothetical protein